MKIFIFLFFFILITVGIAVYLLISALHHEEPIKKIIESPKEIVRKLPLQPKGTHIVAVGDAVCDQKEDGYFECRHNDVANLIKKIDPDAVLVLGDIQYDDGSLDKFKKYYDASWGFLKNITYPVPGNHEYGTRNAQGYFEYFGERAGEKGKGYYSFDIGNWHIVGINSNCWAVGGCGASSPQGKWLIQDLQKSNKKCTIAFWHHPRFSSGHHGNTAFMDDFWKILVGNNVEILLSGHDHEYERFNPKDKNGNDSIQGTIQFVVGTGGRSLYSFDDDYPSGVARNNANYGVLHLLLDDSSYTFDFKPIEGGTYTDHGEGKCF